MSQENPDANTQRNMDVIRSCYEAFSRGDLDVVLQVSDPDIKVTEGAGLPGSAIYHGREGLQAAIANWAGEFDDFRVDLERITARGDTVVSLACHRGRGKQSGTPVEARVAYLNTFRRGLVVSWEYFATWEEALEAAGLSE